MGFSPEIKRKTLVASARHCCVCHRYKGLKIEVHHIQQESDGGPNTFDNAIPLCLDCHTDAGHYNNRHPKGTKLSEQELIIARNTWYELVKTNQILEPVEGADDIHTRYIICKDLDASREIIRQNLSYFPVPETVLVNNEVLAYFKFLDKLLDNRYWQFAINDSCFKDVGEYLKYYPDAVPVDKSDTSDPYYGCTRIPKISELITGSQRASKFIEYLLDIGLDPKEFIKCVTYPEYCGMGDEGGVYCEQVVNRPLWFIFLHITNTSSTPVSFIQLQGKYCGNSSAYKNLNSFKSDTSDYKFRFPKLKILPTESVLIPLYACFAPYSNIDEREVVLSKQREFIEQIQQFSLSEINNSYEEFSLIGVNVLPENISYQKETASKHSEIHELDLNRVYSIDRYFMCGSCPHLFFRQTNGSLKYVQELFALYPGKLNLEQLIIPRAVNQLIIAELEDETTIIKSVEIKGNLILKNSSLTKGQIVVIDVSEHDSVRISGTYESIYSSRTTENLQYRNDVIGRFMKTMANEIQSPAYK